MLMNIIRINQLFLHCRSSAARLPIQLLRQKLLIFFPTNFKLLLIHLIMFKMTVAFVSIICMWTRLLFQETF